ncbi:hypothetical protein RJ639_032702 [Escallonia herrerae]|uniref:F-box protein n=1 Tax=Escallonia herrerae TaxID=1293975 RepID=A0AA88WWQ4_9ASTE|nr:hypothetical protein RJ639_032702 [Escallonia herrerae]
MERFPADVYMKIFFLLDHQNLATAQQVCRKWKLLGSENVLWSNLFKERWGEERAIFYAPVDSKSWKDAFEVQDRCDRVGVGLKIIREGDDCYLIHQGEIQRHLGSRKQKRKTGGSFSTEADFTDREEPCSGILDKMLFFLGDLEAASGHAKRSRLL